MEKSELVVSGNISMDRREEIGQQLGAKTVVHYSKYLGLPSVIKRGKKIVFQIVVDRVISQLKEW